MTVGLQVYSGGTLVFDSTQAVAGQIIDAITETNSTVTYNYPAYAGFTVELVWSAGYSDTPPTVSYASGYPSITMYAYADASRISSYFVLVS